jgi:hypothetical protein
MHMDTNTTNHKEQNVAKLALLSLIFCRINGLPIVPELTDALSAMVVSHLATWYAERGRTLDLNAEPIEEEAVADAFSRAQLVFLAAVTSAPKSE